MSLLVTDPFILAVYKPVTLTSAQVVGKVKRLLGKSVKKIGHFGTLDPFAEGLLLIGANGGMRLMNYVHDLCPKTYLACGLLGVKTDTGDLEGKEVARVEGAGSISIEALKLSAVGLVGEYWQAPPAFSAAKFEGKALYSYARQGIHIEKPAVQRFIHELEVLEKKENQVSVVAQVSSGTYIRVLFEDLAAKVNSLGHLIKLKRTFIGPASAEWAVPYENLVQMTSFSQLPQTAILRPEELLPFPIIEVAHESLQKKLRNGSSLSAVELASAAIDLLENQYCWLKLSQAPGLLGLYQLRGGELRTEFLFAAS
jgi:tRNA pseudouridine55 synthase